MDKPALRALAVAAMLCSIACSGVTWRNYQKSPDYRRPSDLRVVIYARGGKGSVESSLRAGELLGTALKRALSQENIGSTVVQGALDPPPAPRAELRILSWDGDSRGLRDMIGMGTGGATLVVDCAVFLPNSSAPMFRGVVFGSARDQYESSDQAIDDTARAIAKEIAAIGRASD